MTKPLPHRPGKGGGAHRKPTNNSYRIDGALAFVDVGTKTYPGEEAVIDLADIPLVIDGKGRWFARAGTGKTLYATRCISVEGRKVAIQMHRHLCGLSAGHEIVADHRDGRGLNNTRKNLRKTDHSGNKANATAHGDREFKGVFARTPRTPTEAVRFRAIISIGNRRINIGNFASKEAAARAYDGAAREHFGEFALTNFPHEGA